MLLPGDDPSPYLTHDFGNKDLSNTMAVLCRTCGLKANKKHCRHIEKNRYIEVTTTIANLNYSLAKKSTH